MPGFSEKLLRNHFKLYEGYVKNTNKIMDLIDEKIKDDEMGGPRFAELQRRFGWEFNGMRLHEVFFGNLMVEGDELEDGSPLAEKITADFGSFDAWKRHFSAIGGMRGIGWACLYYDPVADNLLNVWVEEHATNHLATAVPILLLDVFEHAFMLDYGTDKDAYIKAFFDNVCWSTAMKRFEVATKGPVIPMRVHGGAGKR
jgi:superoxide dismutase, Fe-Mn family